MEAKPLEIREEQRNNWDKAAVGWRKWDDYNMKFLKPMGDAIIAALALDPGDSVLDIASGTGQPAITIASLVPDGTVMATDLSASMLAIAMEHALEKKLANFVTRVCDACDLPFAQASFNKISCRMGYMFFPDMQLASDEFFRVLKQGGRFATSVWGAPQKNLWVTGLMDIINRNIVFPPPVPGAPSMFRCAQPGFVAAMLQQSGFKNIREQEITGHSRHKDFHHFWEITTEVSPVIPAFLKMGTPEVRQKIKSEMEEFSKLHTTSRGFEMSYGATIISAEK